MTESEVPRHRPSARSPQDTEAPVHVSRLHGVVTIRLDRPEKRNALTRGMLGRLEEACASLNGSETRAVVMRGSGGFFCAGMDLNETVTPADRQAPSTRQLLRAAIEAIARLEVPTIAAVQGPCIGAGCALALACDLRIADDSARFGVPVARIGVVYPAGDLKRLATVVGPSRAKSLLFTGEIIDADRALQIGLVDEVRSASTFDDRLSELQDLIVAGSRLSQQAAKVLVDTLATEGSISPALESACEQRVAEGAYRAEGIAAFQQRRRPMFGRPVEEGSKPE